MSEQTTDKNERTYTQKDYDGVIAELSRVRDEKAALKKQIDDLSAKLDALESDKKKTESERERTELENKGKYDEAMKKVKTEYDTQLESLNKQLAETKSALTQHRIDNVIMGEASGKVIEGKAGQVVTLLKSEYRITEKDGGEIEIMTADGKPVLDRNTGKALDLKGLTNEYLTANPHLMKPTTAGGAGSHTNTGTGGVNPWKKETRNITEQMKIAKSDPAKAAQLKAEAGVT